MKSGHNPIAVTILTGFLGSGKTTFLNQLLRSGHMADAMVLINEFGEVGLDHLLVENMADDMIIELSNGCLCCTIRSDLLDRLVELLDRIEGGHLKKISRLVIETTGLADPIPILQLFMAHPLLLHGFRFDGVMTVVDSVNGLKTLDHYKQARHQVALADWIIVSKSDLLPGGEAMLPLRARLGILNQNAQILLSLPEQNTDAQFLLGGLFKNGFDNHHGDGDVHHHHHDETLRSFCLKYDRPLPFALIEGFLGALRKHYGDKILRLKGLVATYEHHDKPLIIHAAQGLFHPPQWRQSWPNPSRETCLIVISDGVEKKEVEELFGAFTGQIGIDRADWQALSDNPLAIAGKDFSSMNQL